METEKKWSLRQFWLLVSMLSISLVAAAAPSDLAQPSEAAVGSQAEIQIHLPGFAKNALVARGEDGALFFDLRRQDGAAVRFTPDELAEMLSSQVAAKPWWARLLNVSSARNLLWVGLGVIGQLLFTGRMLVQWLISERRGESVVPTAFWWLSLGGATLLIVYFGWRRDLVGVMGQAFGWVVYVRNLHLLSRRTSRDQRSLAGSPSR